MDINIPSNVKKVMNRLEEKGFEAFIVGGCVRDSLMGITPHDFDITTNAVPEQMKECFSNMNTFDTGIKHGTITVVSDGENIEVTAYRIDGRYSDNRHPESVKFTGNIVDDLSRRDFTVNSMAYSHRTGIIDRFGGQRDLFNRCIRCVGDPDKRFNEDALRIIRALRFASCLDFTIEDKTAEAVRKNCGLLENISRERISSELKKLLCGTAPASQLIQFPEVFTNIIPEFKSCVGFDQHSVLQIYDVWEHTAHAVENSAKDKYVRLALFFHDIEKPSHIRLDDEGNGRFPGHEKASAETAEKIMQRLKFDNKTTDTVCTLIKYHYVIPVDDKIVVKKLLSRIGEKNFIRLLEVLKGDSRAKQSIFLEKLSAVDSMKILMYDIIRSGEAFREDMLAINGTDIEENGFSGKEIGTAKARLLELVMEGKLENTRETLTAALSDRENILKETPSDIIPIP